MALPDPISNLLTTLEDDVLIDVIGFIASLLQGRRVSTAALQAGEQAADQAADLAEDAKFGPAPATDPTPPPAPETKP